MKKLRNLKNKIIFILGIGITRESALILSLLIGFMYLLTGLVGGGLEAVAVFRKNKLSLLKKLA